MKKLFALGILGLLTAAAAPASAACRNIYGYLKYTDYVPPNGTYPSGTTLVRPIRNVTVSLKKGSTLLGTATTSSNGYYSKCIDTALLPTGSTLRVQWEAQNYAADVYLDLDWANDWLTWKYDTVMPDASSNVQISKTLVKNDFSVHFHILDVIQYGRDFAGAPARRDDTDDITQVDVEYPDSEWSNYYWDPFGSQITLSGPTSYGKAAAEGSGLYGGNGSDHGFLDETILHEYGHHLEHDISDANEWGNSTDHNDCTVVNYDFGWKEGYPTFFAEVVQRNNPVYIQSDSDPNNPAVKNDLETDPNCANGAAEGEMEAALMDVYDTSNEDFDRISGNTLVNGASLQNILFKIVDKELEWSSISSNILGFHDAFVGRNLAPGLHADLDRILVKHKIYTHALADYSIQKVTLSSPGVVAGQSLGVTIGLWNNTSFYYTDEPVHVQTYIYTPGKTLLDDYPVTQFTGSKSLFRSVLVPANVPQGSYPVYVEIDPGYPLTDRVRETGPESNVNGIKPAVSVYACGDGVCSAGESCSTCAADCGSCCGNGTCDASEDCASCAQDCGGCGYCGDGYCMGGESYASCPADCEYNGGGSCFVAGTPITLPDGTTKAIEAVEVGDEVLSFDPTTQELVPGRVTRLFVHPDTQELVTLNDTLVTTVMHPFYVQGHWVRADWLNAGDVLLRAFAPDPDRASHLSVAPDQVQQVESSAGKTTTYNFEVAGTHTYFAGGFLVHNLKGL